MSHILCTDRTRRHRLALFASCTFTAAALALSAAPAVAGCNSGNVATSALLHSEGCQANATGFSSTAVAKFATAGNNAVAVGVSSVADANSTSVGTFAEASSGGSSVAIGYKAIAIGHASTIVGMQAGDLGDAANTFNSAFGIATGRSVTGSFNTAIGANAGNNVGGASNIAVGAQAGSAVTGSNNAVLGTSAGQNVTGHGNVAIGQNAGTDITAFNTVAIGRDARATKNRAVAIGQGSLANVADTVSVGINTARRRIVNVENGTGAHDAVTVSQLNAALSDAAQAAKLSVTNADLRRELAELRAMVQQQQQAIAELKKQ